MLVKGWISLSTLLYGHPALFAQKKCGVLRLYVDYRSLSANTRVYYYPILCIDKLLDRLSGCSVVFCLDLQMGNNQIEIEPAH